MNASPSQQQLANSEARKELEPKCVPQLLLGPLQGTRRPAIGHLHYDDILLQLQLESFRVLLTCAN